MPREQFVDRSAEHWGELNTIHSFREGNTRTQFVFFSQLAENAGYRLATEAFKVGSPLRDESVAARFYNQATTRTDRLAAVLSKALDTIESTPTAPPPLDPELQRIVEVNNRNFPSTATEIGQSANGRAPEARSYQPPQQELSPDHGYGR